MLMRSPQGFTPSHRQTQEEVSHCDLSGAPKTFVVVPWTLGLQVEKDQEAFNNVPSWAIDQCLLCSMGATMFVHADAQ